MMRYRKLYAEEARHEGDSYHIQRDKVRVTLPVRVNWGGGWTDTPPILQ